MTRNSQLTPLGICALGLLVERPMHPYEMYQVLMQRHEDRLVKVRPGTLYHTVGRLASAGLVEPVGTERDGNRPERTTYAILPPGKVALDARIKDLLSTPVNEFPSFPQALDEAHNLPAGVVVDLLDQRIHALEVDLADLGQGAAEARSQGVERRYLIDIEYQQAMLTAETQWVHGLCAELTAGTLAW
ncbi:transcriptional regulator [Arthrobacter alpinus]|uniref:Transcriptional regulator n=1 Tax=Arthrobacter alpinus TaxID=656366 RepID=A0A0M4QGY5_9MICC|nr:MULTISPECIES: PadR family transcriptional regulator [Arthrobacter]ALE93004.1 transcriptional regulator [Arthrobacter alpinus]